MMTPTTGPLVLRIERTFNASRERVFAAWTTPEIIRQWSAPAGLRVADGEGHVVPGGRWRVVMVNDTTGERHVAVGTYLEVERPVRLHYTHAWQGEDESFEEAMTHATTVTIEFHETGSQSRMVFIQAGFESAGSRDGHADGWKSCFDLLAHLLAESDGAA